MADGFRRKLHMVAQHQAPVRLFQAAGGGSAGLEPVVIGVIAMQFIRRGRWMKTDEAALAAPHHREWLSRGLVEAVRCGEQGREAGAAANQTGAHATSFPGSRWLRIRRRTSA